MSALKYIMDMGDDEDLGDDKNPRQPSVSGSARSPDPSSTAETSDSNIPSSKTDQGKSLPARRGPPSRSSRSATTLQPTTTTAGVDKASQFRSPIAEKSSVDSSEPMDPSGYGSYAHTSSPSNMPPSGRSSVSSRPMSSAPGESDVPIRLTPVTGRVSRAKKGVAVHVCDICKPAKTYTRAEHLRRHQLSHGPPSFQCHYRGCNKVFHREDLLTRHTQRHEQDERSGTDMTGGSGANDFLRPPVLSSTSLTMIDEMTTNTPACYPTTSSPYSAGSRGSISGQGQMSPSAHSPQSHQTGSSQAQDDYILSTTTHQAPPFGISPNMDSSPFHSHPYKLGIQPPRRSPPYSYISLEGLPGLTIPDGSLPGHLYQESNWSSSPSGSPYSTPTPDRGMIRGYDSPSRDVTNQELLYVSHQYPSPHPPVYNPIPEYPTPFADDPNLYDFQSHTFSVRSPPPTVTLSAQPVENLVTLGPSVPDAPAVLGRQKGSAALLSPYSDAAFLTALVPSSAALSAIPHYLDIYWKRFDVLFPLVHGRSLETSDDPVLRCAMAAVGSQFLQSKEDRINGHILHVFASQEARRRPQWGIHVMQAILLCEFYSRFRGSKAVIRASEPFQSLYSRDHLLSLVLSPLSENNHQYSTSSSQVATSQTPTDFNNQTNTGHHHWDQWIVDESRRRLLTACFVLDAHASMYHEHSILHNFPTPTPPIPLTKPTKHLWEAQDPEAWAVLVSAEPAQLNAVSLADEETTAAHVNTAPPLDLAVYLASETLRLPRRSPASTLDVSADLDLTSTERIRGLFPGSPVANTYLALHHTPLRDLLAVSGDSWLFSRKLLDPEDFRRRKASVRAWSSSVHAGAACTFAAKALLAFLHTIDDFEEEEDDDDDDDDNNTPDTPRDSTGRGLRGREWHTSDMSGYWALYVCALICWSLGHRTTRGAMRPGGNDAGVGLSPTSTYRTPGRAESEATAWLQAVASLDPEVAIQNVRGRREALGVIAMVRRRLENEAVGGKSKLLVDAVRVLKALEEDPNRARF
ncbi:hypothetical protein F5Y14DRAFT_78173 [Nemania sp. NC0429]|nr:hypothetical protein F5Y14DRAFT_78173 [Nemania sp. NC0429]